MYGYLAGYSPDPHDRVPELGCHGGVPYPSSLSPLSDGMSAFVVGCRGSREQLTPLMEREIRYLDSHRRYRERERTNKNAVHREPPYTYPHGQLSASARHIARPGVACPGLVIRASSMHRTARVQEAGGGGASSIIINFIYEFYLLLSRLRDHRKCPSDRSRPRIKIQNGRMISMPSPLPGTSPLEPVADRIAFQPILGLCVKFYSDAKALLDSTDPSVIAECYPSNLDPARARWLECTALLNSSESLVTHVYKVHAQDEIPSVSNFGIRDTFLIPSQIVMWCSRRQASWGRTTLLHKEKGTALRPSSRPSAPQQLLPPPQLWAVTPAVHIPARGLGRWSEARRRDPRAPVVFRGRGLDPGIGQNGGWSTHEID
ncbi:hypothetical protein B0H11DRAFT_1907525 [Mycena galericulata]|nr:hypothetical protein B0H11DRAFT_1907525 [Mycena galericulata]